MQLSEHNSYYDAITYKKILKIGSKFEALLAEIVQKDDGSCQGLYTIRATKFLSTVFYLNKVSIKPKEYAPILLLNN